MNAFFIGIGGMGMSGIAKILKNTGHTVAGSDRNLDGDYCRRLKAMGVALYQQDGTGLEAFVTEHGLQPADVMVVKSTAVEDQVPDVVTARRLGIREIMRSDLLANLFHEKKGIAIGGSAGKTTTTGLVTWLLKFAGLEPTCAVGGIVSGLETNALVGDGPHFIIEADESDGSIVKYHSHIALLSNISRDHKSMDELRELFGTFLKNVHPHGHVLVCSDDEQNRLLLKQVSRPVITYGTGPEAQVRAENIVIGPDQITFTVEGSPFTTLLPGLHNVQNAVGAIAIGKLLGIPLEEIAAGLLAFPGMKRRFERVGIARGVTVVDDFAHNPAEIQAAIRTARHGSKRRFIVYQPHGFGPTRFTRPDLVKVFSELHAEEYLYLDDIFYGGGTVEKDITSRDIIEEVRHHNPNAFYLGDRRQIAETIAKEAKQGDLVLVMGARDINTICRQILDYLQ